MDIPRGHAAMPLTEADFLDFIYNYFKAEYAPIRSFWSTATADPRQLPRWINMGHEMSPLTVRPANAQAQKDLESLDYFTRKWNLDASFIRGLVIRFAKYEVHDRLEKKLFECARLDLMVRKALKEKHLIDALWPSPAPRNLPHELLAQGVAIRKFYGDMFNKYFRVLHSIDEFELRPEVDMRIKNSGTLMLVPFVDHLIFGAVDPIMPIVAKGAGYSNAKGWRASGSSKSDGFGEPSRFEIRFDAPADVQETYTKTVSRQCQCNKCGTKRDVQVVISIDPNTASNTPAGPSKKPSASTLQEQRRHTSKTAQRYAPGYDMPANQTNPPRQPRRPDSLRNVPSRSSSHDRAKPTQPTRLAFPLRIEPAALKARKQEPGDSKTRGTKQTQSELDAVLHLPLLPATAAGTPRKAAGDAGRGSDECGERGQGSERGGGEASSSCCAAEFHRSYLSASPSDKRSSTRT
jgi:hypothetical protein